MGEARALTCLRYPPNAVKGDGGEEAPRAHVPTLTMSGVTLEMFLKIIRYLRQTPFTEELRL